MTQTVVEDALAAYYRCQQAGHEEKIEWVRKLSTHGVFSKRNLSAITDLPVRMVDQEVEKSSKTGGRFNPEMLPLIYDFESSIRVGVPDLSIARVILSQGVSSANLSRLVGVPRTTMQYWTRDADPNIR